MSVFILALVYTNQEHIASLLDKDIAGMYVKQRDLENDPDFDATDVGREPSDEAEKSMEEKLADIRTCKFHSNFFPVLFCLSQRWTCARCCWGRKISVYNDENSSILVTLLYYMKLAAQT